MWVALINDTLNVGAPLAGGVAPSYSLYQNFPNPFNPTTMIRFDVPRREHVVLEVFDVVGQKVATLLNRDVEPGEHTIVFSVWEYQLSSGLYFYRMVAGSYTETKKFVVQR